MKNKRRFLVLAFLAALSQSSFGIEYNTLNGKTAHIFRSSDFAVEVEDISYLAPAGLSMYIVDSSGQKKRIYHALFNAGLDTRGTLKYYGDQALVDIRESILNRVKKIGNKAVVFIPHLLVETFYADTITESKNRLSGIVEKAFQPAENLDAELQLKRQSLKELISSVEN